jgi:O-antigen/teichoic acid export membrane protein
MVNMVARLRRYPAALGQTVHVVVGLAVQAMTAYLTLILAGRILGAAEFGKLAALYVLLSSVPAGLFQPLEQEVARRRGRERETGHTDTTLLLRAVLLGMCLCLLAVATALVLFDAAVRLLGNEPQLLVAFCIALPGYALCFVSRGAFSGSRRLARYGLQLSVEGAFRLVALGCLALIGPHRASAYGWLFGLAPWVALAVSMAGLHRTSTSSPDRQPRPLVAPIILLLASSLTAQLLIGAGPATVQFFADTDDDARAGSFLAALVVVRVPVFLFTAVQPSLLPALAAHVAADRRAAFRSLLAKVLAWMGLLAFVTTVVTAALGPSVLRLLFGPDYVLPWSIFLLMGISVGLFLACVVLGQAVLALGEHHLVTLGWLTGLVGLAVGTVFPEDAILKATMGLLVGGAAAAVTFALLLWRAMRRWRAATPGGWPPSDAVPDPAATGVIGRTEPESSPP